MFIAIILGVNAQYKMQVWMNGSALDFPVSQVDSITFVKDTPDTPDVPNPGPNPNPSNGIGVFSVSASKQVTFSPGNLQYHPANYEWRFAENQYDYVGSANSNISATYNGWIDLFGWGTGNAPTKSITDYSDYQTFVDWGTNKIGDDAPNTWRTLSKDEWMYIFYNRPNAQSLFALGSVNGVNGTIILPDNWTTPAGVSFVASTTKGLYWDGSYYYNSKGNNFSHNTYTTEQWSKMEQAGAVFLPASGYRWGADVYEVGYLGYYWSSTEYDEGRAYCVYFDSNDLNPQGNHYRDLGFSVRLVKEIEAESGTPDTTSFPLISTVPEVIPMGYDGEVTIIFNPNEGNKGMQLATACYAHTGIITSASSSDFDWKNVVEGWRVNTSKTEMTREGDNWVLVISNIYEFYGCPADTEIKKLAFIFHDGPYGDREGKTAEGTDIFVVLEEVEEPESPSEGIGVFSVSASKQVAFSKGNLQYHPANNEWRFAPTQTDYIGSANSNISATYNGWLDLFGWGTGNAPTKSSTDCSDYQTFVDWGTNKIGADAPNTWRTLSSDEWVYIFYNRPNAQSLFALGSVNGVNGTIILPDNWTTPAGVSFVASTTKGLYWNGSYYRNGNEDNYSHNTYTSEQWSKMKQAGAVFLPASGSRWYTGVDDVGNFGGYWSSTEGGECGAYGDFFSYISLNPQVSNGRTLGYSVRLAKDVEGESAEPGTPPANTENGHEYVDLGLPSGLKWATCNVGANAPEEYGDYFAWGETTTKSTYNWSTYKYCNGSYNNLTKYNNSSSYGSVDNKTVLDKEDDAAAVNWGGKWRMPTKEEQNELYDSCNWTWTTQNGVNGYTVTGPNGKSIFLPAAGYRDDSCSLINVGRGYYWSSSLYTDYSYGAYGFGFGSDDVVVAGGSRSCGQPVRPVCQ